MDGKEPGPSGDAVMEMRVADYIRDGTALCHDSAGLTSTRKAPRCQADVDVLMFDDIVLLYMNKNDMDIYSSGLWSGVVISI